MTKVVFDKLRMGKPTLGIIEMTPSPELVELCGYVGFDYVLIDRMVTSVDWVRASEMVRAADAFNIASIIRAEADPWRPGGNSGLATELTRALSIGADGICMSIASTDDLNTAMEVAKDWHRRIYITRFSSSDSFRNAERDAVANTIVMPLVESQGAIEGLEGFFAMKPTAVFLGMGDISRLVGDPGNVEHPGVWEIIDRAAALAREHNVVLAVNTGRQFRTPRDMVARTERLLERGVTSIIFQHTTQLLQYFCEDLLADVRNLVDQAPRDTTALQSCRLRSDK